jgi:copper homeostasis protein
MFFTYLRVMVKKIETELCAYSLEAVETAVRMGATRVELCASPLEGGTTPSAAAIEMARETTLHRADVEKNFSVELSVMIRPRGGDFLYSEDEFALMKRDIAFARDCGADGVVFGLLTPEGDVDVERTGELVRAADLMECTFHRAFDVVRDPLRALEDVIATGCRRILTSGGMATAPEGIELLRELVRASDGRIEIMAGSGVNPRNAQELIEVGVDALHFSAQAVRKGGMKYRNPRVVFSPDGSSDHAISYADPEFITEMVGIVRGGRNFYRLKNIK